MPGLTSEVVANSNSQILVFSSKVVANSNANGSVYRVAAGGFVAPGVFGSSTYPPSILINVYAGSNGTSADPLVTSTVIYPPPPAQAGQFAFDAAITLRGNTGVGGNAVFSGLVMHPQGALGTSAVLGSNGAVNAAMTANAANISVYALAGSGQNASVIFETCTITEAS
jgi:hypothetical protein